MPTKDLVTKVWIEEGCIVCDACETTAPTVFEVTDTTCIIRPAALNAEFTKPITADIIQAAEECPVDVIKYTLQPFEVSEAEMAAAPAEAVAEPIAAAVAPAKAAAHAPAAKAPAPAKPAAAAVAAQAPVAAMAADADPTMQLLLRAAKARGGRAGMEKAEGGGNGSSAAREWADKPASELPPDAQHAKAMEATKAAAAAAKEGTNRRDAMKAGSMAVGVGWATFGTAAAISFGPGLARFLFPNITEEPDPKVRVGELTKYLDMPPGGVNEDYKPNGIWMIRLDDRIAALNIICTHLGCIPNWLPNDRKFKCPCHGSGYFQDGVNFEGPTPRPLERFKIEVVDGIVVVDKSRKFQYELGQWENPDSFLAV